MIDLKEGKVVADEKIKQQLSRERPYKAWLTANRQNLPELAGDELYLSEQQKARYYQAFAYSREDINMIIKPMALTVKSQLVQWAMILQLRLNQRKDRYYITTSNSCLLKLLTLPSMPLEKRW